MVKYKIGYVVRGEVEVEFDDLKMYSEVVSAFNDRVGFSEDDLYENLDHDFKVETITITER